MQTYNPILKSLRKSTADSDCKSAEHKYGNSNVLPRVFDSHCTISSVSKRNQLEHTVLTQNKPIEIEEIANSQRECRISSQPYPYSTQTFPKRAIVLPSSQEMENSAQCDPYFKGWSDNQPSASPQSNVMDLNATPHLFEAKTPLQKYRTRNVVSVTSFSSQLWCEKQFELQLESGKKRETAAMKSGIERHACLELNDHPVIDVEVSTIEDYLGLRLYSSALLLKQLLEKGKCRELWVAGLYEGIAITGIIDEIRIRHVLQSETFIVLSDTKTRRKRSDPSIAQTRTSSLQLQLYYFIVEQLKNGAMDFSQLFDIYECDPELFFNVTELLPYRNLNEIVVFFNSIVMKLPPLWENMEIVYENEGVEFRRITVEYNKESLRYTLRSLLEWWFGHRAAQYVIEHENFKCKYCDFLEQCSGSPLSPATKKKILEERRKNELLEQFKEKANALSESGLQWDEICDIAALVNCKEIIRSRFSADSPSVLINNTLSSSQTISYKQYDQKFSQPEVIDVDALPDDQHFIPMTTQGEMQSSPHISTQNLAIIPQFHSSDIPEIERKNLCEVGNSRKHSTHGINVIIFPPQNCNLHLSLGSSLP
ncbi:hypothetical protein IE077_002839 [Cardiosporidium cionae]|uniref:Exonuclease V n=1 Tax=Cardiosporidium cionae TaxID=476202 RepID=A0ABQ7J9W1_9APIC|nr:hypothetical protein IE077_002839 [Cardiosporidium cionae]|eukprot:KAF8820756.1 hypothetical protein IE077_002839 [Cardiosporidium cionae]